MKRSNHLFRLLAVFSIVGLVIAPLSARANRAAAASLVATSMSADMPCCPDKSAPMDCDQCQLMAFCMVKTWQIPSLGGVVEVQPVTLRMLIPVSDPQAKSLAHSPPPKPPRSPVRSA